jgi:alpha-1,2-mannosyltransferase
VPALRGVRPSFTAQAVLVGATLAIYGLVLIGAAGRHQDFDAYLKAGADIFSGQPLYTAFLHHPFPDPTLRPAFIYPPAFALLVTPLAPLPRGVAVLVWLVINQAALWASLALVLRWLHPPAWATVVAIAATATFYPLWIDVTQGQANLLILFFVTVGVIGVVGERPRMAAALGAAAGLKVTPGLFLLWLLIDRRFKAAMWMAAGYAALTAVAAAIRWQDTVAFFTRVLPALASGTAFFANQSLSGVVDRVLTVNAYTRPWLALPSALPIIVLIGMAMIAYWFWRTLQQPALVRAAAFIPLLTLLSAVTWPHHLVILLPVIWFGAIAIAGRGAGGRKLSWPVGATLALAGVLLIFDIASRLPVGPNFGDPGFGMAQTGDALVFMSANALFFGQVILFFLTPWLLRSR